MCQDIKIISKIKEGQLSKCKTCNFYHLTYNNILFELTNEEFESFKTYLNTIEIDYWEHKYSCSNLVRKIPVPTTQQNLFLMFNRKEINDLKSLIFDSNYDSSKVLKIHEIEYVGYSN